MGWLVAPASPPVYGDANHRRDACATGGKLPARYRLLPPIPLSGRMVRLLAMLALTMTRICHPEALEGCACSNVFENCLETFLGDG